MKRRTGSGRPITVKTDENAELVEERIWSQEDFPGTHKSPREIARNVGISRNSVTRLVKRRKINQFKRLKTPHMNNGTRDRRAIRSGNLAERFDRNPRLVEKFAYQDEKYFTLEVPTNIQNNRVYLKGKEDQVPDVNLFHQKISSPSKWWYQLVWHVMGQPNHFLLLDVEWKWMQRHTSDI